MTIIIVIIFIIRIWAMPSVSSMPSVITPITVADEKVEADKSSNGHNYGNK
jgi:hypothetical protein